MIGALLALALPALAGVALVRRVDAGGRLDVPTLALWLGIGLPLGVGLAGVIAWLWLIGGGILGRGSALVEGAILAAVAIAAWRGRRGPAAAAPPPMSRLERAALALACAGVAISAATFVAGAPHAPHGDWDAWAIWNLHARFLALGERDWRLLFGEELTFSHNDYPLLLPAAVARTWASGATGTAAPTAVAALFTIAAPLAVLGAVSRLRGTVAAAIATLLLAACGEWVTWGLSQNADVPVGALVAAGAACLSLAFSGADVSRRWLVLSSALLGIASLTKDEGIVYLFAAGGWALLRGGRAGARANAAALAAGCAVPLLLRVHFHVALSPTFAAIYTTGQSAGSLASRLGDLGRWGDILATVPRFLPGLSLGIPLVALALPWILGARPRDALRSPALAPVLAGYAAYVLAYAVGTVGVNAERLNWHIVTSAPRVLLHPWPALLIALLALVPWIPPSSSTTAPPAGSR